jgi:hypothetical protein
MGKMFAGGIGGQTRKGMPGAAADLVNQQMKAALDGIKVDQSGSDVIVKTSVDSKAIQAAMAPMMAQMVRGIPQGALAARPRGIQVPIPAPQGIEGPRSGLGNVFRTPARAQNQNNLKELALALMLYADAHGGQFPPAVIYSKDGKKPLYSWRVELLPFLEQQGLYNRFKKDEPWDSPHNKLLLTHMPKVFSLQGLEKGMTCYQVFVGPKTPWPDNGKAGPRLPATFLDGTSNTILVAEAAVPVEWTRPADMVLAAGTDPKTLLGASTQQDKCYVAMADGSVRSFILSAISDQTLRNAINPSDGMPLGPDFGN